MQATGASPAVTKVVATIFNSLGTDLGRRAALCVEQGRWDDIPTGIDPSSYPSTPDGALQFRDDFQVVELVRKRVFGGSSDSRARKENALKSWKESESANYLTNLRISDVIHRMEHGSTSPCQPVEAPIIDTIKCIRSEIRRVIGRLPSSLTGRFSSGTNQGPLKRYETIVHKLAWPSCTPALNTVLKYNGHGFSLPPMWQKALSEVGISINSLPNVNGEGFGTVPKNYETDRTIGKQPVVNLFFQLGVGEIFRRRLLKRARIDLNFGHLEHSRLAMEGSISNRDATIDLRNSSNSLCLQVIRLLFDKEWFELLSLLRSDKILVDKRWRRLEMISAMGNGFTFELQTLVFWAVCRACGVLEPKVYGDDIIVPSSHAQAVISVLKYLGLQTNPRKTFIDGPFRESCGGNFFKGVDVTPIRIVDDPKDPAAWFSLHNAIYRLGPRFKRAKDLCLAQIPVEMRKFGGPTSLGDIVLHGRRPDRKWRGQIGYIKCWRPLPVKWMWKRMFDGWVNPYLQLSTALEGSPGSSNAKLDKPRRETDKIHVTPHYITSRGVSGYKVGRVAWSGNALATYSGDGFTLFG